MSLIRIIIVVTILTTLGGAAVYMFIHRHQLRHKTKDDVYKEYFKPYTTYFYSSDYAASFSRRYTPPSDDDTLGKIEHQGFELYENKEYAQSIQYFEAYLRGNPSNSLIPVYLGVAYMVIDSIDKAELQFGKVLRSQNYILSDIAKWYDALIALNKEYYQKARTAVSEISTMRGHEFKDQAKALVIDLDKLIEEQAHNELNLGVFPD